MHPLSWKRNLDVKYHYEEGKAWLGQSKRGKRCTALSYAAFEFRLAIERIIFQYWFTINDNQINSENINDVRSFKKMQSKIYSLGGSSKQNEINKYFEFIQIILDSLQIDKKLTKPDLGKLHKHWQHCSELCHITWTIFPKDRPLKKQTFCKLEEIQTFLNNYISDLVSWPTIVDDNFNNIQKKYIAGDFSGQDVRNYLNEIGLYATHSNNDGSNCKFIGTPIKQKVGYPLGASSHYILRPFSIIPANTWFHVNAHYIAN